jgi:ABC-type Fe3+/spermidine/putrescine transport system ATPase subunit
VVAVSDIDLSIGDGEYVTILGPSGCGKTTLIKVISGIWEPTEGEVLIDHVTMSGVPIEERDVGYVFQNIALFPHLNVLDNVSYGPRVKRLGDQYVNEIPRKYLDMVRLLGKMGMFPSELAGGEQQKVSLARALASGARLLLLDEPLSALDTRVRVELRYELRRLAKGLGLTVIHVTHDQEEAMSVSDRIVLMRNGRIVEISSPKDLYREPRSLFAANFVGETNLLEGVVVEMNDMTQIKLRDGSILGVRRSDFSVGDAVVVSVRPENVYPSQEGLRGTVTDVVFMGTYFRVASKLTSGDKLEFDVPVSDKVYNEGDDVRLELNKNTAQVFQYPSEGIMEAIKLE